MADKRLTCGPVVVYVRRDTWPLLAAAVEQHVEHQPAPTEPIACAAEITVQFIIVDDLPRAYVFADELEELFQ